MTKAICTLKLCTGEESTKEFIFAKKKDAVQLKKMLEKGALIKRSICTCTVQLVEIP